MSKTFATIVLGCVGAIASAQTANAAIIRPIPIPIPPWPVPGDGCENQLAGFGDDVGASFDESLKGVPFSVGASLGIQAVADCDSLGVTGEAAVDASLFGGAISAKPISVRVEVSTNDAGRNAATIGVYSFGKELYKDELAKSSSRLKGKKQVSLALPVNTSGSIDDSLTVPEVGGTLAYEVGWEVVSFGGMLVRWDISSTKVFAAILGSATMNAELKASASYRGISLSHHSPAYIYWTALGANGTLGLSDGVWKASGGVSASARGLEATVAFNIPVYGKYKLVNWPGFNWAKDLIFPTKTFSKSF